MNKILFINHSQQECGVYQYGKRVSDILINDNRYNFQYFETDSLNSFQKKVNEYNPNIIIYNWHPLTMKWLTPGVTQNYVKEKQLFLLHEGGQPTNFKNDGFLMSDLSEDLQNKKFSLPRPIFETNLQKKTNNIPIIGSFGFGFKNKGFERICRLVNKSFDNAIIHLHITNAFFGDKDGIISQEVIQNCKNSITKQGITLKITTNFISNEELLSFLNNNTVLLLIIQICLDIYYLKYLKFPLKINQ